MKGCGHSCVLWDKGKDLNSAMRIRSGSGGWVAPSGTAMWQVPVQVMLNPIVHTD